MGRFLWPLLIGMRKTKEYLYTAKLFDAKEAQQLGLINHVVPVDQLDAKTVDETNSVLDLVREFTGGLLLLLNWFPFPDVTQIELQWFFEPAACLG